MTRPRSLLATIAVVAMLAPPLVAAAQGARTAAHLTVRLVPGAIQASTPATSAPPTTASCLARSGGRVACYSPAQLRAAYDLAPLAAKGVEGQHQTIVIVDAFGSPTIAADLKTFDTAFKLPAPPSLAIIQPAGPVAPYTVNGTDRFGWASETTLDVEWAHALAPKASIVLVETPTDEVEGATGFPDIVTAENYVVSHHLGTVISQSFGATEQTFTSFSQLSGFRSAFIAAQKAGITVLASSGDLGATDYESNATAIYPFRTTSWPASDPLVTSVGGTKLTLSGAGTPLSPAVAWNDVGPPPEASGGGRSVFFTRPSYQSGIAALALGARAVPDISMSAACSAQVDVYEGFSGPTPGSRPGWHEMCGTSEASPLLAAIIALADQEAGKGLGLINAALYAMSAARTPGIVDVTSGNNTVKFIKSGKVVTVTGFQAAKGYDLVTGVGTVDAAKFVPALVKEVKALAK